MIREYLTIEEVADYTKYATSTVYKKAREGSIPHRKKGHKLLFIRDEIDKWIDQGKRETHYSDKNPTKILTSSFTGYIDRVKGGGEMPKGKTKSRLVFNNGAIFKRKTKNC